MCCQQLNSNYNGIALFAFNMQLYLHFGAANAENIAQYFICFKCLLQFPLNKSWMQVVNEPKACLIKKALEQSLPQLTCLGF